MLLLIHIFFLLKGNDVWSATEGMWLLALGDLRSEVRVDLTILALGLDLDSFPKFSP